MPNLTVYAIRPTFLATVLGTLVDSLFRPLVGLVSLLLLLLLPADAYEFTREPHDYILIHHLDVTQPHWQWQYLQGSILWFVVAGLTLGVWSRSKVDRVSVKDSRTFSPFGANEFVGRKSFKALEPFGEVINQ